MAKIIPSALISQIQGSVGSVCLKATQQGLLATKKSGKKGPQTDAQRVHQNTNSKLRATWSTLTQAEKDSWNQLALQLQRQSIVNGKYPRRGYDLFLEYNYLHITYGDAVTKISPNTYAKTSVGIIFQPNGRVASFPFARVNDMAYTPTTSPRTMVFCQMSQRGKQLSSMSNWKRIIVTNEPTGNLIITTQFAEVFGFPKIGQLYRYKFLFQAGTAFPSHWVDQYRTVVV